MSFRKDRKKHIIEMQRQDRLRTMIFIVGIIIVMFESIIIMAN